MNRDPAGARARMQAGGFEPLEWIAGDAMDPAHVARAAETTSLIVHAVNPPGYRDWIKLVLPMLESSVQAASVAGARILPPGTIHNYGPDAFPVLTEESPRHPCTRKGAIRVHMEQRLRQTADGGVRGLIVRAGDFFGPGAANNWFSQGLVRPGRPVASIRYPGAPGIGHQWAYLPDVAETMVRLLEHDAALSAFETFLVGGHWDADGAQMIAAIRAAVGQRGPVKPFPWWLLAIASPAATTFREMMEMKYLWRTPIRMRSRRLVDLLGDAPHTPLELAVRTTLAGLGCLP